MQGCQNQIVSLSEKTNEITDLRQIIDTIQQELTDLKNKRSQPEEGSDSQTTDQINYLRSLQRRSNLVFSGLPMKPTETEKELKDTIFKIGDFLGVQMRQEDVKAAYRIKSKRQPPTATNPPALHHAPAAVIVKFAETTQSIEALFLSYLRMLGDDKALKSSDIGFPSNRRIFINHHLSPELLKMKNLSIILKKEKLIQRFTPRYNAIRVQLMDGTWHKLTNYNEICSFIYKLHGKEKMDTCLRQFKN